MEIKIRNAIDKAMVKNLKKFSFENTRGPFVGSQVMEKGHYQNVAHYSYHHLPKISFAKSVCVQNEGKKPARNLQKIGGK